MEITRQADYAVRCLLFMAKNPQKVFMVKDLADQKLIPRSFLAKILQRLAKAGLVKSTRGVKGGFMLTKPPARISVFDIVEAIDGPIQMNKCVLDSHQCELKEKCQSHPLWMQLQEHVTGKLKKATLQNLKTPEPKN